MRHRDDTSSGRGSRWLAGAGVGLMLLSATTLVLLDIRTSDPAEPGPGFAQSRRESREPGFAQSRREGGEPGFAQSRREGGEPGFAQSRRGGGESGFAQSRREGWRTVLAGLDRRRAVAYAAGDPALLTRVYLPGSPALRRDERLLARYRDRGVRVLGLRMDLLEVRVRRPGGGAGGGSGAGDAVLVVRERVAGGTVVGPRARRPLPNDDVDRRVITLRRVETGEWRIDTVRPA